MSSQKFKKVTHCLFDMDGLLLNTEHLYTNITQRIISESGNNEIYTGDFKVTLMGMQGMEVAVRIVERYKLSLTPDEYQKLQHKYSIEVMPNAKILPGVERLLRHLHAHKVPMCLATSSSKEMYDLKTVNHNELFSLFNHKVYGSSDDEVVHGKPSPDIFIVAARRFDDPPDLSDCLVFEDAPNGVKAATAAGCQSVMVPEYYVTEEMKEGATLVLNSLEDFKPEAFGLPPFKDEIS